MTGPRATGQGTGTAPTDARGTPYGLGAYLLWGAMPVYFRTLAPAGAWEILGHRILWSLVLCLAALALLRPPTALRRVFTTPRRLAGVTLAGALIAVNWTTYLVAVTSGRVTEAALGYFLNPLVSVALGLLLLGERLRPLQWVAVAVGGSGALYLSLAGGRPPWIAFVLAGSFGLYGLVKKRMGAGLSALDGLLAETAVLAPFAAGVLVVVGARGEATALAHGTGHAALLASTGVVTAVPLLLFAAAARRIPLVTIGLLQFVAPVLQFVTGILLGETMTPSRWIGFTVVWVALVVLVADSVLHVTRRRART